MLNWSKVNPRIKGLFVFLQKFEMPQVIINISSCEGSMIELLEDVRRIISDFKYKISCAQDIHNP